MDRNNRQQPIYQWKQQSHHPVVLYHVVIGSGAIIDRDSVDVVQEGGKLGG